MVLYHGSNMAVEQPDLNHSKTNLDFGAGFYTTSDLDQAKRWAVSTTRRRGTVKNQYTFKTGQAIATLEFRDIIRNWQ